MKKQKNNSEGSIQKALSPLKDQRPPEERKQCNADIEEHCITCSDQALPARVLQLAAQSGQALVEIHGTEQVTVDITLMDEIAPGDWLLVHGGVAIGLLEEAAGNEGRHA